MLYHYPFYRFPYYAKGNFYPNYNSPSTKHNVNSTAYNKDYVNIKQNNKQAKFTDNLAQNSTCVQEKTNTDTDVFNFFGLELHFDDILIIFLLIFLYKEETDDMYLYIALLLLLFS